MAVAIGADFMTIRFGSLALITLGLSLTLLAQTSPMRPGNWQVTMKMSMPGIKMEMPPITTSHCVTADMVKDPQSAIPKGPNANNDCKVSDYRFTANTATYKMMCTKPTPMNAIGEMKYSGTDAYTGTMTMESQGQTMTMSYDAKRLGECPK
jgi:hypothetical protein